MIRVAVAALLLVSACGPGVEASESGAALGQGGGLPAPDEALPAGAIAATRWDSVDAVPDGFDRTATYESATAIADAYGEVVHQSFSGSSARPTLGLDTLEGAEDRAVLVISEHGAGDDSVVGTQHALVAVREPDGWHITSIWARSACRRGTDPNASLCR